MLEFASNPSGGYVLNFILEAWLACNTKGVTKHKSLIAKIAYRFKCTGGTNYQYFDAYENEVTLDDIGIRKWSFLKHILQNKIHDPKIKNKC